MGIIIDKSELVNPFHRIICPFRRTWRAWYFARHVVSECNRERTESHNEKESD